MEPGTIYDDLITRYLLDEATPEEKKLVKDWMAADEKNRLYVEALQKTIHLVSLTRRTERVDVNKEWEQLRQVAFKEQSQISHFSQYNTPEWELHEEDTQNRKARIYKLIAGAAVAASVMFLVGLGAGWFSYGIKPEDRITQQEKLTEVKPNVDPLMAVVQHEVNTSGKTKQLILPDGSRIALFDSSEITYKEPVDASKREVYLVGKADFQVAKDKAKPFTVFSGEISTTAIGTRFTVVAKKKEKTISIKLFEGKVVIKSLAGYNDKWAKDLYLQPVQELVYDKIRKTVTIYTFSKEKTLNKAASQVQENPSIPNFDKRSWFMFNNQPVSEILDALAEMYGVKIYYSKNDVKDMYFIGTYDKSDSLENILKQIALLNNLKLTVHKDTFKIEKQAVKK